MTWRATPSFRLLLESSMQDQIVNQHHTTHAEKLHIGAGSRIASYSAHTAASTLPLLPPLTLPLKVAAGMAASES